MKIEEIGKFLKNLREQKDLTQDELAEKLNISRQAISRWETGKSMPDYDTLVKLSKIYNINVDEILIGKKATSTKILKQISNLMLEKNKFKRTRNKLIVITILLFVLFSIYFLFLNYNKVYIYELYNYDEDVHCRTSLLVITPKDAYFKTCDIWLKYDDPYLEDDVKDVEYYYINNVEKKVIIASGGKNTLKLLNDKFPENGYFSFRNIKKDINNIHLHITTIKGKEFDILLNSKLKYSNSFISK